MCVYELHEVKCIKCGKSIPCCFFYCIECEIEMLDKLEEFKKNVK